MNLFDENVEVLPRDLLLIRYNEIKKYVEYLQMKVNEFEKYYDVEIELRQSTPSLKFSSITNKTGAIEVVRIPERKFIVYKPYVRDVQEIINQYLYGTE